jgi:phosphotransferase system IIB component
MKPKTIFATIVIAILLCSCGGTMQSDALKYLEDVHATVVEGTANPLQRVTQVPDIVDTSLAGIQVPGGMSASMNKMYIEGQKKQKIAKFEESKKKDQEQDERRLKFIITIDTCIARLNSMVMADGAEALKKASLDLLSTYKTIAENEYKQLVELYISGNANQASYDAINSSIQSKMKSKSDEYRKAQEVFGEKYRIDVERNKVRESIYKKVW